MKESRESGELADDPFVGLNQDTFARIEKELLARIDQLMGLSPSVICYDMTNFYTYIDEPTSSELASTCQSKDSKHHLRHMGLLMAVERNHAFLL